MPVTATIALLPAPNNGRFPYANSLLIQDGGCTVLVDTGCGGEILTALQEAFTLDYVICTHSHVDHTSGNWRFNSTPIWLPAGVGFETGGEAARMALRFQDDPAVQAAWLETTVPMIGFRDAPPTDAYPPGHVFTIGGTALHSIPAPGHSADHTCFWEPESSTLLATDIDFTRFGPWYGNPESDIDAFMESIRRVWALGPWTVISSHKGLFREDIDGMFQGYLDHFARREARILAVMAEPTALPALVEQAIIYGCYPRAGQLLRYFEQVMLQKHLARLAAKGLVQEVAPGTWRAC